MLFIWTFEKKKNKEIKYSKYTLLSLFVKFILWKESNLRVTINLTKQILQVYAAKTKQIIMKIKAKMYWRNWYERNKIKTELINRIKNIS